MNEQTDPVESNSVEKVLTFLRQEPESSTEYIDQIKDLESRVTEYYKDIGGLEEASISGDPMIYTFGDIHARPEAVASAIEAIKKKVEYHGFDLDELLRTGEVVFSFVGDLVHAESNEEDYQTRRNEDDRKKIMQTNLNTVLGIMELKLAYPESVYVVKGNHDVDAVEPGEILKFSTWTDQGKSLKETLGRDELGKPINTILNTLPLLTNIHVTNGKHLVVSHALPIVGDVAIEPVATEEEQLELLERIRKPDEDLTYLFTWGAIGDPDKFQLAKTLGSVEISAEKKRLKEIVNKKIYTSLSSFMKSAFGKTSSGEAVSQKDILWIVGHEHRYGLSKNLAEALGSGNPDKLKIFQINNKINLPVVSFRLSQLGNVDLDKYLQDNVRKFEG